MRLLSGFAASARAYSARPSSTFPSRIACSARTTNRSPSGRRLVSSWSGWISCRCDRGECHDRGRATRSASRARAKCGSIASAAFQLLLPFADPVGVEELQSLEVVSVRLEARGDGGRNLVIRAPGRRPRSREGSAAFARRGGPRGPAVLLARCLVPRGEEVLVPYRVERSHLDRVDVVELPHRGEEKCSAPRPASHLASDRLVDPLDAVATHLPEQVEHPAPGEHAQPLRLLERGDEEAGEPVEVGVLRLVREVGHGHRDAVRRGRAPPCGPTGASRRGPRHLRRSPLPAPREARASLRPCAAARSVPPARAVRSIPFRVRSKAHARPAVAGNPTASTATTAFMNHPPIPSACCNGSTTWRTAKESRPHPRARGSRAAVSAPGTRPAGPRSAPGQVTRR